MVPLLQKFGLSKRYYKVKDNINKLISQTILCFLSLQLCKNHTIGNCYIGYFNEAVFLYNAIAGVFALPVCTIYAMEEGNMLNI